MLNNSQEQAIKLLNEFSIRSPNQIAPLQKIVAIAEYNNIHVIPSQLKNCLARITIIDNQSAIIRYNQDVTNEHLIKFSIAHELGHFILHNDKLKEFSDSKEMLTKSFNNKGVEKEADEFASELLMPTSLFIDVIDAKNSKLPDFILIDYLSAIFNTSTTAAAMKLVQCGKYCIALIACENNKIKWFFKDPEFSFYIKDIGTELDPATCAYDCFKTGKKFMKAEEVYADTWVKKANKDDFLMEHTFYSDFYNFTLSIIWRVGDIC